ncbi:MAG: hypothetical protein V3V99_09605 [candidate division Zixibacteria bacterium]
MIKLTVTGTVIFALFLGGFYLFIGKPADSRIRSLNDELFREHKKLEAYHTSLSNIDNLLAENQEIYSAIGNIESNFSGEDEVIALYHTIDSFCHRPGYQLEEITPSLNEVIQFLRKWDNAESIVYLPMSVKIRGRFDNITRLCEEIEKSVYFHHLTESHIIGSEKLYPDCYFNLAFVAGLSNRMGLFSLE